MIVIVLTSAPPKLRGHLTRWLLEISAGVYVGKVSARVRDLLWVQVLENLEEGKAVMVYSSNTEQGLEFKTYGQTWQPIDYDGLELILRPAKQSSENDSARRPSRGRRTGWSNASRYRRFGR